MSEDMIKLLPKVALHDHLDGGLRPQTVIDHCREASQELPSCDAETLGEWFFDSADSGNLVDYLQTFEYTVAAMQTPEHLKRVAREFVLDHAADGVVYAEARWAPEQHTRHDLSMREAVEAVRDGLHEGMAEAAEVGAPIVARQILTSMRHGEPTLDVAQLAVDFRDDTVVGFDIAGAEDGWSPTRFEKVFEFLRRKNMQYTIHAGEASGPKSIWEAVQLCGARRIGHGVRICEEIEFDHPDGPRMGRLAHYLIDTQIPLEIAVTSNAQTGVVERFEDHPVGVLRELGFNITINCDNRLMSGTTMTDEFARCFEAFGWGISDMREITVAAMNAAFCSHEEKQRLLRDLIEPAYARARR
ncbi:MAG: adenosine deaminase [Tessaracoccus sp.]